MQVYYLSALATLAICLVVIFISIVRLGLCHGRKYRPRIKYTLVILCACAAMFQPYYEWMYGVGNASLAICILVLLVDGTPRWKKYKDKNEYFDTQLFDPDLHGGE